MTARRFGMKTLTLLARKGGVGKTTLAVHLAVIAATKRPLIFALATTLVMGTSGATESIVTWVDGNRLHVDCLEALRLETERTRDAWAAGSCVGYITGVVEALQAASVYGGSLSGRRACIPASVTPRQTRDVVMRFLQQNPEKRHKIALDLVVEAIDKAFPCPPR